MSARPAAPLATAFAALLAISTAVAPGTARAGIVDALILGGTGQSAVPLCHDPSVLDTIRGKFAHADARVLKAGLTLAAFDHIHETWVGHIDGSPILRRFCKAEAHLADGRKPPLYYLIEQDYGFVGITWNVEFCMIGYEPWRVHDGNCRTVRKWW